MKKILAIYKSTLSVLLEMLFGKGCRFSPTCSEYAAEAIETHGVVRGSALSLRRLSKCHPWGKNGFDPVPKRSA